MLRRVVTSAKPVAHVFSSHVMVQLIGFGVSILLVNHLSKTDYALYTLLMSVTAILSVLSNSGLLTGFKTIGSQIWEDKDKMACLVSTTIQLRKLIALAACGVTSIYAIVVLNQQGENVIRIIVFVTAITFIVIPEMNKSIIIQAMLLRSEISVVQWSNLIGQVFKGICITAYFYLVTSTFRVEYILIIAIISAWVSYFYINVKGKQSGLITSVKGDKTFRQKLLHYIKIHWHNSLFFAFKGQLSIFCISIFGSHTNVADLGALMRYSLIFSLLNALISNLFAPQFGRSNNIQKAISVYIKVSLTVVILSIIPLIASILFPSLLLSVLGESYKHLEHELVLVILSGIISVFTYLVHSFNTSKGWLKYSIKWEIPLNLILMVAGAWIFNLRNVSGVLEYNIVIQIGCLFLYVLNSYSGFKDFSNS